MKKTSKNKPSITHKFNIKLLVDLVKVLSLNKNTEIKKQTYNSFTFYEFLKKQKSLNFTTFKINFDEPLYRVSAFYPTSVMGSFAYGGRFNIGGSQINESINIKPFPALYLSTSLQCAIDEYTAGTPLGPKDTKYALTPLKSLKLWDIDKVIKSLSFPNLNTLINQGPISNSWGYCKVPTQSQILAFWLKEIGGDGIFFRSTQNAETYCVALFVKDDTASKALFSVIKTI